MKTFDLFEFATFCDSFLCIILLGTDIRSREIEHYLSIIKWWHRWGCFTLLHREGFGDASVVGDPRWAGGYGINADFIAMENSHVAFLKTQDILVSFQVTSSFKHFYLPENYSV